MICTRRPIGNLTITSKSSSILLSKSLPRQHVSSLFIAALAAQLCLVLHHVVFGAVCFWMWVVVVRRRNGMSTATTRAISTATSGGNTTTSARQLPPPPTPLRPLLVNDGDFPLPRNDTTRSLPVLPLPANGGDFPLPRNDTTRSLPVLPLPANGGDFPLPRNDTTRSLPVLPLPANGGDFPLPRNDTTRSLVVMVLSRRNAFSVRQAIRETWASGHDNVYFVLGQGCPIPPRYQGRDQGGNSHCKVYSRPLDQDYFNATLYQQRQERLIARQLHSEQEEHHDLLLMPHTIDMYQTLPAKLKFAYTFVHTSLPSTVHWVLKVDEDFYVRIDSFEAMLNQKYPPQPKKENQAVLVGEICYKVRPLLNGKWKELPQFPFRSHYPPFPQGSGGHAVTRRIASYVATYQDALFDYQGEDVSIGIWLHSKMYPSAPPTTVYSEGGHMSSGGKCRNPALYVVGHKIAPSEMKACFGWDASQKQNRTHNKQQKKRNDNGQGRPRDSGSADDQIGLARQSMANQGSPHST